MRCKPAAAVSPSSVVEGTITYAVQSGQKDKDFPGSSVKSVDTSHKGHWEGRSRQCGCLSPSGIVISSPSTSATITMFALFPIASRSRHPYFMAKSDSADMPRAKWSNLHIRKAGRHSLLDRQRHKSISVAFRNLLHALTVRHCKHKC